MASRDASSAAFNCHLCQSSFARQEHLTRHIRSHTNERPYKCAECGKCFSRQDVLNRHMASHSAQAEGLRTSSSRACTECAASRVRCSKNSPCNRCRQRSLECTYPTGRKRKASSSSPYYGVNGSPTEQESGESSAGSRDDQPMVDTGFYESTPAPGNANIDGSTDGMGLGRVVPEALVGHFSGGIVWPSGLESAAAAAAAAAEHGRLPPESASESFPVPELCGFVPDPSLSNAAMVSSTSGINWLSPQYPNTLDWEDQLAALPQFNPDFGFMNGLYAAPDTSNSNNVSGHLLSPPRMDAAAYPVGPPTTTRASEQPIQQRMEERSDRNSGQSSVRSGGAASSTSKSTEGTFYVEGTAARAPFRGRMIRRASSTSNAPESAKVRNASAHGMAHTPSNMSIVVTSTGTLVSDYAYDNMRREIQTRGKRLLAGQDLTDFPSLVCVRHYAHLYFELFHPAYPFIRRHAPAFDEAHNWILILAISVIGSIYAPELHSSILFNVFDKLLEGIERPPDVEPNEMWVPHDAHDPGSIDLPIVQAKILHLIYLLHSGKRGYTERALRERRNVIDRVKGTSLLCPREDGLEADSSPGEAAALSRWIQAETRSRTGMMIWLLDAMIAAEFGCPPLLQLYDAKLPLPSQDYLWDNPTTSGIGDPALSTATISEAIDILYIEKRLPPDLGEFSNVLLIYAVCRRTSEAIYQHQTRLPSWVPDEKVQARSPCEQSAQTWPPSLQILSKWRNSACDCLDILHWNANGVAARAGGWEHSTILHLHLSRLLILTPTQHMKFVAAGSALVANGGKMDNKRYLEARSHLFQWAIRDQFKARLSMVHAGALLWHVRRYSSNNFLEPFAIYLATLAIWSYSVSAQSLRPQQGGPGSQMPGSAGGSTGASNANASPSHVNGISPDDEMDEDPEPSFVHLDRPCDDEMVQVYVRLGHKMNGYMLNVGDICGPGAPEKILKEGVRLLSIDRYHHSKSRPQEYMDQTKDVLNIWEIEKSYVEILNCLIRVTKTDLMG